MYCHPEPSTYRRLPVRWGYDAVYCDIDRPTYNSDIVNNDALVGSITNLYLH